MILFIKLYRCFKLSYSSSLVKLYWIAPKDQIFVKGYGYNLKKTTSY